MLAWGGGKGLMLTYHCPSTGRFSYGGAAAERIEALAVVSALSDRTRDSRQRYKDCCRHRTPCGLARGPNWNPGPRVLHRETRYQCPRGARTSGLDAGECRRHAWRPPDTVEVRREGRDLVVENIDDFGFVLPKCRGFHWRCKSVSGSVLGPRAATLKVCGEAWPRR